MEPARYVVTFADLPLDLVDRLRPVLAAQGSPPIEATADGATVVFRGATGEFMVRARAADALAVVWPTWQQRAQL